ncbi:MAG: hypothetical protein ABIH26_14175 [Candidatus Eisenbacteria bacterium]
MTSRTAGGRPNRRKTRIVSSSGRISPDDDLLLVLSDEDIELQAPSANGRRGLCITIKLIGGAGTVTVLPYGEQTIEGEDVAVLTDPREGFTLVSCGSLWHIV